MNNSLHTESLRCRKERKILHSQRKMEIFCIRILRKDNDWKRRKKVRYLKRLNAFIRLATNAIVKSSNLRRAFRTILNPPHFSEGIRANPTNHVWSASTVFVYNYVEQNRKDDSIWIESTSFRRRESAAAHQNPLAILCNANRSAT